MGKNKSSIIKKRKNKLNYIRNLIEDRNYKRALYEVVKYVNTYPEDVLGHYLYGKLLLRKNELQGARKQFMLVIEYQEENEIKALMNLATIARREGDPEEAIKYYKQVIENSDYTDIYAINVLAHLYRYEKEYKKAIELIDKCPPEPELLKEKAKNLSILGKTEEALSVLAILTPESRLEEREISLNKGRIAKARDEYDQAQFYYEDAKDGQEKDVIYFKAVYEEIKLALAYEKYADAITYCEELLFINNHFNGEIYLMLGQAKQGLAEYTEAYSNYKKAAVLATDRDIRANSYYYLGSLEFAKGDLSLAETSFKRSVANARETSEKTYTKLIGTLLRQDKYEEVGKYLNRFKKLTPEMAADSHLEYVQIILDKRLHKKLPTRDTFAYAQRQVIRYKEKDAIEHIKSHHQGTNKTRGNFNQNLDIEKLYYDIRSRLNNNDLVNEDVMDIYEIDYKDAGYDLEDNLVHRIRVVVFPNTRNILTMYPGCRATVPRKGEFKQKPQKQKIKV